jgi:predicted phosphate transport protein (TIGR00153 family)
MAKKKQYNYFEKMTDLAQFSNEASKKLVTLVNDYDYTVLPAKSEDIHITERNGDAIVEEIIEELAISFITPIDREDILLATNSLDDVLDGINEITYLFENLVIETLRPRTADFVALIEEATEKLVVATKEFAKFKNSKTLKAMLKEVNEVEGNADKLYSALTKDLYANEKDAIEIIKWRDIYNRLEKIVNDTEKATDIIGGLVIKNS